MGERPDCIIRWQEIEEAEPWGYRGDDEAMGFDAPYSLRAGLARLGLHHQRLLPGRRTSYPHAESAEEEFVYVLEGTPDLWLDGTLHRLAPGDAAVFPPGTGQCHSFLNNTDREVRLLVVGDRPRAENRIFYPCNPEQATRPDWWADPPTRPTGPHDGLPDAVRAWRAGRGEKP